MVSNWLHRLAHFVDPSPCRCETAAYQKGWRARRDAELRELTSPRTPSELDEALHRQRIADSERGAA